jgi:2-methylcitrate dehydratase PrpD
MSLVAGLAALLRRRPVTADDRRRAALHVLDWVGCAAAGAAPEVGAVFLRAHAADAPAGVARVVLGGDGGRCVAARDAALANGAFGNVPEMDGVHREAILRSGPIVVLAAPALAAEDADAAAAAAMNDVLP